MRERAAAAVDARFALYDRALDASAVATRECLRALVVCQRVLRARGVAPADLPTRPWTAPPNDPKEN